MAILRSCWFFALLPVWLLDTIWFSRDFSWQLHPHLGLAAILFDWCVFIPLLRAASLRDRARGARLVGAIATACGGLWVAQHVLPDNARQAAQALKPFARIAQVLLLILEGTAALALLRAAKTGAPSLEALQAMGIPDIMARAMLAEARFWGGLARRIRKMR